MQTRMIGSSRVFIVLPIRTCRNGTFRQKALAICTQPRGGIAPSEHKCTWLEWGTLALGHRIGLSCDLGCTITNPQHSVEIGLDITGPVECFAASVTKSTSKPVVLSAAYWLVTSEANRSS